MSLLDPPRRRRSFAAHHFNSQLFCFLLFSIFFAPSLDDISATASLEKNINNNKEGKTGRHN